ncbi:unnamed protein product [Effrenium voratum]|uniref:FHA domain-containing protein n=1 Tax=Effrenium voratum TaxID=2562239 RepID=A0AA36HPU8_9DINO|nr:unnamed protein product [Effrenium voratum]
MSRPRAHPVLATAAELVSCTRWLWSLLLALWVWIQRRLSRHGHLPCKPELDSSGSLPQGTTYLKQQLEDFDECPIQMTPMLEPVRVVHEDEDARMGQPAHIMDLEAAKRWLSESPAEARCPFCRGRVLHVEAEPAEQLKVTLRSLAEKTYTNSEGVAHKAVRLGDARLLTALGRLLPAAKWRDSLLRKNAQGKGPFELLAKQSNEEEICGFMNGLDVQQARDFKDFVPGAIVHSRLSARFANGCEVWSRQNVSDPKPIRPGDEALVLSGSVYYLLSVLPGGDSRVVLLRCNNSSAVLCTAPLAESLCQGRCPELYEPGLEVALAGLSASPRRFVGRFTIGGAPYIDDFVVAGISRSAAALRLEAPAAWCLQSFGEWEIEDSAGKHFIAKNHVYRIPSRQSIQMKIQPQGIQLVLRPCFLARRATEDFVASLKVQPSLCDSSGQKLVLVRFQMEQLLESNGKDDVPAMRTEHVGAVAGGFSVGRCGHLAVPMAGHLGAAVSRRHCLLQLRGEQLVAYDDGSALGTKLNGEDLGVGPGAARAVQQGDVLALGGTLLRLAKVSPVLRADDDSALPALLADMLSSFESCEKLKRIAMSR